MRITALACLLLLALPSCRSSSNNDNGDLPFGLRSIAPDDGPMAGDQPVAINGTGFDVGILRVLFGGVPATNVVVTSDQNINCDTPPGVPGTVDVTVETTDGQSDTLPGAYRYNAPPRVFAVVPVAGPAGLTVSIVGANFDDGLPGGPEVGFGGLDSPFPQLVANGLIFATVPSGNPGGAVDVTVTNANGTGTRPNGFTYILGAGAVSVPEDLVEAWEAGWALLEEILVAFLSGEGPLTELDPEVLEDVLDALADVLIDLGI